MQDRYTGDIGDFGKYGLLRVLCPKDPDNYGPKISLGVNWYFVPEELVLNERGKNDGIKRTYLQNTPKNHKLFRSCDPPLYDALKTIDDNGELYIQSIKKYNILPSCEFFYERPLSHDRNKRSVWAKNAYEKLHKCDVIFMDPDNGLEVKSAKGKKRIKYILFSELDDFWKNGNSLIIYQHSHFGSSVKIQIKEKFAELKKHSAKLSGAFTLQYHRGTSRFFIIIPNKKHKDILLNRAKYLLDSQWGQHFT